MSHILEPLVRDNLWQSLAMDSDVDEIAAEVSLGEYGTIDLVARMDNSYIGYEIKSETLTRSGGKGAGIIRQLEKYKKSEQLDKIYICSIEPEEYKILLSDNHYIVGGAPPGVNSLNHFRESLAYSITEGEFTISDLQEAVEVPSVTNTRRTNRRVTSKIRINKLFSRVENFPDERVSKKDPEVFKLSEAVEIIEDLVIKVPKKIGIMGIPIETERGEAPRYGTKLLTDVDEAFCSKKEMTPTILQEAEPLVRSQVPLMSHENEAWISHCIWVQEGGMREATLPNPEGFRAKRVDNLSIDGSKHPQQIVSGQSNGSIKAYEAKTGITPSYWEKRIKDQLKNYLSSVSFTHLYLAVPQSEVDISQKLINESQEDWISYVGLVSVDTNGTVTYHVEPKQISVVYDGWATRQGRRRTVGYGKLIVPNEPEHTAIFGENDLTQEVNPVIRDL